jgi:uncharacterized membrane protein
VTQPTAQPTNASPQTHLWQLLGAALLVAGYGVLSHQLMLHAAQAPWAVAALFGPLVVGVALAALPQPGPRRTLTWVACAGVVVVLVITVLHGGVRDMQLMYVLQHAGIHLALAWGFGITLRPGNTALITAMAARLHTVFTPAMRAYTRWLTGLWVVYFLGMVVVSVLIYTLAPWAWWSAFCNLATPVLAVAFFVGEHFVRYVRHPEFERVSLRAAFSAYQNTPAAGTARTTEAKP